MTETDDEKIQRIPLELLESFEINSWQVTCLLIKDYHNLKITQFGQGKQGKKVGWAIRDTARELKISTGKVCEYLKLAEVILVHPEFKKIESQEEAYKTIKKQLKQINQRNKIKIYDFPVDQYIAGRIIDILAQYQDNIFDVCIFKKDYINFNEIKEIYRVLKQDSFLYIIYNEFWNDMLIGVRNAGFNIHQYPLIWIDPIVNSKQIKSWEYKRNYRLILYAVKGSPALLQDNLTSVYSCKAPELVKHLLNHCSIENSLILNPLANNFSIAGICKAMNRRYISIDEGSL